MRRKNNNRKLLKNARMWAFRVNAGDTGEACRTVFTAKMRDPFESGTIQSGGTCTLHQSGFLGGTLMYSTHAHIHSSGMPSFWIIGVCVFYVSKSLRSNVPRPSARCRPLVQRRTEICSYGQCCHIVDLSRCEKSLMESQKNKIK